MFVLAENVPANAAGAAAFVARYSPAACWRASTSCRSTTRRPLSRRFVTVSGDGDVYFLRTAAQRRRCVAVGFRALKNAKVIDVSAAGAAERRPAVTFGGNAPVAAVRPLNRQQVIETAFAFEGVQWQLNQHRLWPRSRHRVHRLQPHSASRLPARQAGPAGARHSLLLGLPWFARAVRRQAVARRARRQCLHPQRAAHRCNRRRLLGLRQRRLGPFDPLHHRGDPGDHDSRRATCGTCAPAMRSTSRTRT